MRIYSSLDVGTLPEVIVRASPDIIHFAAHGDAEGIVLAQRERGHLLLTGEMLADLLSALAVRPKLIVINACNSAKMAGALVRAADFAIGTDVLISNIGARNMAATLYQRLANAASVFDAFLAARTMLRLIDQEKTDPVLSPQGGEALARVTRLANLLRILACFPTVEKWLDGKHKEPRRGFDPEQPKWNWALRAVRRAFARSSFSRMTRPFSRKTKARVSPMPAVGCWKPTRFTARSGWKNVTHYGSMQWYASVVTSDQKIHSATASSVEALERYYFLEAWRGQMPPRIELLIQTSIDFLRSNDGSRRRRSRPRIDLVQPKKRVSAANTK